MPFRTIGCALLVWMFLGVRSADAQEIRIEGIFPRQLLRGQATLINVALPSRVTIQSAEISPSVGVKVSAIKRGENFQSTLAWSEVTIDVANDATPGERTLVFVLTTGRTVPATITIPDHIPGISELRVLPGQPFAFEFAAADASADLGDSPYVWFMLGCGSEIIPGVVRGKLTAQEKGKGIVHAAVSSRPAMTGGKCDLQVRLSDSGGIESNTLKTTIDAKN
jgi:hypothetical protein